MKLTDTTIIMAVRYENVSREENTETTIDYIRKHFDVPIFVLEADKERNPNFAWIETNKYYESNVKYSFVQDDLPYLYRTKYLKMLMGQVTTPIVIIWDADMIIEPSQLVESLEHIRSNRATLSLPYGWAKLSYTRKIFNSIFRKELDFNLVNTLPAEYFIYKDARALGGVVVLNHEEYLKCGGENPNIVGYGPDDCDRVNRVKIFGGKVLRTDGPGIHLYHDRTIDSTRHSPNFEKNNAEMVKIFNMSRPQLQVYIQSWGN